MQQVIQTYNIGAICWTNEELIKSEKHTKGAFKKAANQIENGLTSGLSSDNDIKKSHLAVAYRWSTNDCLSVDPMPFAE